MVVYPCLTATQNVRLRPQKVMTSISVRDKMGKTAQNALCRLNLAAGILLGHSLYLSIIQGLTLFINKGEFDYSGTFW